MIKSYFIGDLIDLVTDLGGTLKDSEKIWKEYINLLRKYLHSKEVNEFSIIQKIIDRGLLYRPYRISFY